MCGIIGYVGKREALPVVLEGLSRMEYRGYDSAGVAILGIDGHLPARRVQEDAHPSVKCVKAKGKVALLKEKCRTEKLEGAVGIGHTRWATHGEPSERNAHPHRDCTGEIFVAHNGIIENYQTLKERLIKKGHRFASETDTEVIAHLIEEYSKREKNFAKAVTVALKNFRGAFGIVALSAKHPDTLVAARFGSPLILGVGKNEYVVASDATAILPTTNSVVYLNDGDIVTVSPDSYEISDFRSGDAATRTKTRIEWSAEAAEKGGFPHFMLKEIMEQPQTLRDTMRGRLVLAEGTVKFGGLEKFEERLRAINRLTLVAMGTARFTCLIGEYAFEELAGIPAKTEYGSEFTYRAVAADEKTTLLAVSQSGETADTLNAIREARRRGMLTLGIVNVIGSSIAREVDAGIYNHVGPELAVASTKASTSQALLQVMLALYLARMRGLSKSEGQALIKEMQKLPAYAEKLLKNADRIKALARKYKKYDNFFFLGRKYNAATALEGALKLKECAYVHVEGTNAAEFKHGPLALIDKNFPSLVIAPQDSVYEKNKSSIQEIKARKGPAIAITTEGNKELEKIADDVLYIPKTAEILTPVLSFIPMQLLAYYIAVACGTDVDKPRNLAKSVTVE